MKSALLLVGLLVVGCSNNESTGTPQVRPDPDVQPPPAQQDASNPPPSTDDPDSAPAAGIFVDREASVAFMGTKTWPLWDLQEALNEAAKLPREQRQIHICAGTYEYVVVPNPTGPGGSGYDLYGGYRCSDWKQTHGKTVLTGVTMRIEQGLMLHDVTLSGHMNFWAPVPGGDL